MSGLPNSNWVRVFHDRSIDRVNQDIDESQLDPRDYVASAVKAAGLGYQEYNELCFEVGVCP